MTSPRDLRVEVGQSFTDCIAELSTFVAETNRIFSAFPELWSWSAAVRALVLVQLALAGNAEKVSKAFWSLKLWERGKGSVRLNNSSLRKGRNLLRPQDRPRLPL